MDTSEWIKYFLYFFKERADISLKKIVNSLGLSLRDIYKEWHFNMSPKKFLLLLRLVVAVNLLSDSHRKIKDIADELKFCDHIYFCRWFKRLTGITPKKFQLKYGEYFNKGKLDRIKLKNINIDFIYWLSKILENYNEKVDFSFLDSYFWGDRDSDNKNKPQNSLTQIGGHYV